MRRRLGATGLLLSGVLALAATLAGCSAPAATTSPGAAAGGTGRPLDAALASIPQRSVAPMPTARLAKGLVPPTNRWFSGIVFGDQPQPVFPLPLSFGLTGSGFAFGLPHVTTSSDAITGAYNPAISADAGAASSTITAYDTASVTIEQRDAGGATIGSELIAEGSPVVSYTAARDGTLTLNVPFTGSGHVRTATVGDASYGLITEGSVHGTQLTLAKGQTAELFVAPTGVDAASFGSHVSAVTGTSVDYGVDGTSATTTLHYRSSGPNAIAAMPHQQSGLTTPAHCTLGSWPSVDGTLDACDGSTLAWTSPTVSPDATLALGSLSSADRAELTAQLGKDLASTPAAPTDTYFGGKAMYRLANLLTLAHQLGDADAAKTAQSKLDAALTTWTRASGCRSNSTTCFVYDPTVKGVVGLTASFGSDQFNDHMFHYGYFLYAAAVAAKYEPSLTARIRPVIDLLAADIASPTGSSDLPTRRTFDAYAGHSWASGYAPFADGNNQESSSEAVDAWNGLALWASVTGDQPLATQATWMLSAEAASAKAYWTDFSTSDPAARGYDHGVVGIVWGGKRVSATWFSGETSAVLGIQLVPMSPASGYLAGDPKRIARNVAEAAPNGYDVQFGDYLLMYSALGGPDQAKAALSTARALPDKAIDDADSRSYLLAWLLSRGA